MRFVRPLLFVLLFGLVLGAGIAMRAGAKTLCPNGEVDWGEDCDESGGKETATCDDDCTFPDCGDDNVNEAAGESCDDGNSSDGDGCSAECVLSCGNGTVDEGEECDENGGAETATCDDDCTFPVCGDDNVNETAGEFCDDGNTVDDQVCGSDCTPVDSFPLSKPQQACVNAVNRNLAGVAKAQGRDTAACLRAATSGKSEFTACYGNDRTRKVGRAQARTSATFAGAGCAGESHPHFAFTTATVVNDAGEVAHLGGTTILFGAAPTIAPKTDEAAAGCQTEAMKNYAAIFDAWIAEANRAKKAALKRTKLGVPPPAGSGTDLSAAIDAAIDVSTRLEKAVAKAEPRLEKKCTDAVVNAHFDCGGAGNVVELRLCVSQAARASACGAFEEADFLDLDCPAGL
jgi:cysteine-rich repeat protein